MPVAGDPGALGPLEDGRLTGVTRPSTCGGSSNHTVSFFFLFLHYNKCNPTPGSGSVDAQTGSAPVGDVFITQYLFLRVFRQSLRRDDGIIDYLLHGWRETSPCLVF